MHFRDRTLLQFLRTFAVVQRNPQQILTAFGLHLRVPMLLDDYTRGLTYRINGCAIKVHKRYGPGLLEHAYHMPLVSELEGCGFVVECQKPLPLVYDEKELPCAYRLDLLVEETVIVEIKAVEHVLPVHIAQVKTYLKMTGLKVGLLINFNVPVLRHGIRRILHPDLERRAATEPNEPPVEPNTRRNPIVFE